MEKRSDSKGAQGKASQRLLSTHPFVGADGSGPLAEAAARLLVAAAEAEDELVVTGPAQVGGRGKGQYMMSRCARLLAIGAAGPVVPAGWERGETRGRGAGFALENGRTSSAAPGSRSGTGGRRGSWRGGGCRSW